MSKVLKVDLPNGKVCYVTSRTMRSIAKVLRWELFNREQYVRAGFELRANDTVIDVGANIGMFALWAQPQIAGGKMICIEPNPYALKCLAINICQNELDNVAVVPVAVGDNNGIVQFTCLPGWEALGHTIHIDAPWLANTSSALGKVARALLSYFSLEFHSSPTELIAVQQKLLGHIMDDNKIAVVNFLKMDCEGSEYEILRSLDSSHWRLIERAVIECHDVDASRNHREIAELLRANGFEVEIGTSLREQIYSLMGIRVRTIWANRPIPRAAS